MIETILIARDRKTGKDILLAGREVPFRQQLEEYKKLCKPQNEDYSQVLLASAQPHKKPLKFITKAQAEAREKEHAEAIAKAEKEKSAAKKKGKAAKTETGDQPPKTETE